MSLASPTDGPHLSIVIPAFNEEARLMGTLSKIAAYVETIGLAAEVLVVDDGSTDRTAELATLALAAGRGRVIPNGANRGKGYSVRHGVLEARGEMVLITDADLSTPIEKYTKLAATIAGHDVVIGSRALPDSDVRVRQGWLRQSMGRTFNTIIRTATGLPFRDTQCGFKLMNRERVAPLFAEMVIDGFAFDVELLFLCAHFGRSVSETLVIWVNALGSKVSILGDPLKMIADVLRVRARHARGLYRPR